MDLYSLRCRTCKRPHVSTPSMHEQHPNCPFCGGTQKRDLEAEARMAAQPSPIAEAA